MTIVPIVIGAKNKNKTNTFITEATFCLNIMSLNPGNRYNHGDYNENGNWYEINTSDGKWV